MLHHLWTLPDAPTLGTRVALRVVAQDGAVDEPLTQSYVVDDQSDEVDLRAAVSCAINAYKGRFRCPVLARPSGRAADGTPSVELLVNPPVDLLRQIARQVPTR